MYSTYNEGKSVVAERFFRTLKHKLYKHMTATGKNLYYDVLDDVVNKYNNTKMKPKDVKDDATKSSAIARNKRLYIDEHNKKSARYNVGDNLKSQHIATEVAAIDNKTKKNASDILGFENRLKQKEDIMDDVQRENALTKGRDYYLDKMYLSYECRAFSFKYTSGKISLWKSTGINNYTRNSDMDAVFVATTSLPPLIDNGRMNVRFEGAYFKQTKLIRPNNDNIINIYIVYLIDPISSSRNTDYTVQNTLFGGVK